MASIKFEVANFDGRSNNFNIWKIKIMALLWRKGLVYALDDSYPENTKEAEKQKIEMDSFSAIQLSLLDSVLYEVSTEKTVASLRKKLEDLYQKKSVTTRMLLRQRLHTFKMKTAMDLTHADIKVGDEELACTLLFSLSPAYKDVVNSMIYSKEVVMLQVVRHALNSDELRNNINNGEKEDYGEGLTVRGCSSQRGKGKSVARSKSRKKNLISLGTLDKLGYKHAGEVGICKVTKGSMVMLKAKLEGSLYVLVDNTILGSIQGWKRYLLTFIDDFSHKVWVYFLKAKSDVIENFINWKTLIENQCDRKIKCLRINNGLEFCNKEFDNFCKIHGVLRHRTVPKEFWAEAVNTVCYVVNRSPASAIEFKTPNKKVLTTETMEENVKFIEQEDQVTQVESDNVKSHTLVPEGKTYSIAIGRDKRTPKPNSKYYPQPSQTNLVAYALATADEEIKDLEPSSYTEATVW
ncbi:uncharacterized protein LOC132066316 [Lycium ferocissimum]|uniref:uncharacterized protein LOC132066316 n=1 Tax=Lycium ferocissimum TaxID=112874 RepID=UPI00281496FF|nr:uncharacterized protein LOC132066316 [Lycium ferocissimum]